MLQVDVCPYASDALEDAMRLAQTKSLNSYTFSDCLSFLNYVWSDIYSQICTIDSGYYSVNVKLTKKLTKLPKFVKNSVMVYSAQRPQDYNRRIYRQANNVELLSARSYLISGNDLWCPDAERTSVWLEYCPQPAQIFFTHHNRDPKLLPEGHAVERNNIYNLYELRAYGSDGQLINFTDTSLGQDALTSAVKWTLKHRNPLNNEENDITEYIAREPDENGKWELKFITCDYPYIFCSYRHNITGEWKSGFFNKTMEWTDYNPFEWTGRNDNVEYMSVKYNDKTGLGAIVRDWNDFEESLLNIDTLSDKVLYVENAFEHKGSDGSVTKFTQGYWFTRYDNDYTYEQVPVVEDKAAYDPDIGDVVLENGKLENGKLWKWDGDKWEDGVEYQKVAQKDRQPRVKELGWTPDTKLVYPAPEVYRYLVARLAEKFAALNESNIMGVQSELVDARFAFQAFLKKDKSAWERMRNVNPATIGDWL